MELEKLMISVFHLADAANACRLFRFARHSLKVRVLLDMRMNQLDFLGNISGMGERAMDLMGKRALHRQAFGKAIAEHGAFASDFGRCRVDLVSARLTVLDASHALDKYGNKKVNAQQAHDICLAACKTCIHWSKMVCAAIAYIQCLAAAIQSFSCKCGTAINC